MKRVPIVLNEEILSDDADDVCIQAHGELDLDSGDIVIKSYFNVEKDDNGDVVSETPYDVKKEGLPASKPDYDFTSGLLKIGEKELEFAVNVDVKKSIYEVSADELEEIKEKALALASGKPLKKKK